jgi:hypothetical protein
MSSPHIILKLEEKDSIKMIPKKYINIICGKFAEFKKLPKNTRIIYTEMKNVKPTKTQGEVVVKEYQTVKI